MFTPTKLSLIARQVDCLQNKPVQSLWEGFDFSCFLRMPSSFADEFSAWKHVTAYYRKSFPGQSRIQFLFFSLTFSFRQHSMVLYLKWRLSLPPTWHFYSLLHSFTFIINDNERILILTKWASSLGGVPQSFLHSDLLVPCETEGSVQ